MAWRLHFLVFGSFVAAAAAAAEAEAAAASSGDVPGPDRSILVFENGTDGYSVYRIPAVVRLRGWLVAFAEARRHGDDFDHIDMAMKRSDDHGQTWSAMQIVVGQPHSKRNTVHGNPVPIADEENGVLHVVFALNDTWVYHMTSKDIGDTWSSPRNISSMVKRPGWGWMATGPNHGLRMKSGRLVVPFNTFFADSKVTMEMTQTGCAAFGECAVYNDPGSRSMSVKYTVVNTADPTEPPLHGLLKGASTPPQFAMAGDRAGVFYSDDQGTTWHLGGQISDFLGSSECAVEEVGREDGSPGTDLLLSFRVEHNLSLGCRNMARSSDGGATFHPYYKPSVGAAGCISDPACQGSLLSLGQGRVLVTSGPGTNAARANLTIHTSVDGGKSFERIVNVNSGVAMYSDLVEILESSESWTLGTLAELGSGLTFATFRVQKPKPAATATGTSAAMVWL